MARFIEGQNWPKERMDTLVRLYGVEGHSFEEIGIYLGYATSTVTTAYHSPRAQALRKRLGIERRHKPSSWTEEKVTELVWLHFELGWSFERCGAHFGSGRWQVREIAYRPLSREIRKRLNLYRTKNLRRSLKGKRFGKLRVTKLAGINRHKQLMWHCRCSCGGSTATNSYSLTQGKTRSCGCLSRATGKHAKGYKNGRWTGRMRYTTMSWAAMLRRCLKESDESYKWYGKIGVRVCQRMQTHEGFVATVGGRPKDRSLDRIDPREHYSCGACEECVAQGWPLNVKWSTDKQQANNKRCHYPPPAPPPSVLDDYGNEQQPF